MRERAVSDPVPPDRRADQRARLLAEAESVIATEGLGALRARDLALAIGCSVGAIYNLVTDLDDLVLRVGQRTMAALNAHLDAVAQDPASTSIEAQFLVWARAYHGFAATHRNLWRALFEFRMAPDKELPDWFESDQSRLFIRLEERLAELLPNDDRDIIGRRAKTLFSAVHGIVALGLEGKIATLPAEVVDDELVTFVRTYVAGLRALSAAA